MRAKVKTSRRNSGSTFQSGVSWLSPAASRAVRAPSGGRESPQRLGRNCAKLTLAAMSSTNGRPANDSLPFIFLSRPAALLRAPPEAEVSQLSSSPAATGAHRGNVAPPPAPAADGVWRRDHQPHASGA